MRWREGRQSANVEDRRGMPGGTMMMGGGLGSIVLIVLALMFGIDPQALFQPGQPGPGGGGGGFNPNQQAPLNPRNDEAKQFVSSVLADTEDVWHKLFRQQAQRYREPKLVLFNDGVRSACGMADSAVGPFYCPGDQTVYLDLDFFRELKQRFGAPGDFAQAYVIAHEVGHHVQQLMGISDRVHAMRGRVDKAEFNQLSVRLELQADFFAGVWAHHAQRMRNILEEGDIEEAMRAAEAIGDDRLQKQSRGFVVPDSFTHGTSAQRARWFRRGLETGDISQGDTFKAREL
jgi:predicted metalloprotease